MSELLYALHFHVILRHAYLTHVCMSKVLERKALIRHSVLVVDKPILCAMLIISNLEFIEISAN